MPNDPRQSTSSVHPVKQKLDTALARLEKAIEGKVEPSKKMSDLHEELFVARKELQNLREKNSLASMRLDNVISQIKRILGN